MVADQSRERRLRVPRFYLKRAFRIFPAFYVFLGTVWLLDHVGFVEHSSNSTYLSSAVYLRNLFGTGWPTGHLWTLSLEEQFYLFWPLVFALSAKRLQTVTLVLILLVLGWRIYYSAKFEIFNYGAFYRPDLRMDCLLIGCYFALRRPTFVLPPWVCLLGACLIPIWTTFCTGYEWMMATAPFVNSLLIATIICGIVNSRGSWLYAFLTFRPLVEVGKLSYSLYLWQQLFLLPGILTSPIVVVRQLLLTVLVAVVSYRLIEQPSLKLRNRILARDHA
jgi:peptidoglycan/LPS O-acetylase OafA/YrhL